jgi:hypothetical protein
MKVFKKVLSVILFTSLFFFGLVSTASAMEIRTADASLEVDETVEDDLYIFGDTVEVDGTVMGDLVAAGDTIDVSGVIEGDLYVSGGIVNLSGSVEKSVFAAGGQLNISGDVGRSIYLAGGQIDFSSDAVIGEDIFASGGQVYVSGVVGDDTRVAGGMIDIDSEIADDLIIAGGDINVDEEKVGGKVSINHSDFEWEIETEEAEEGLRRVGRGFFTFRSILRVATFIGMLIVGLVLIWLAPVKTKDVVANISTSGKEAGMSLLYGIMAFAVLVILPVILMVTLIGIPLGFLLSMTGILIWTFGILLAEMGLGRTLLKLFGFEEENYFLSLLAGRAVTLLVGWIPCFGAFYKFILFLLALGGIVRVKMNLINRRSELVKKKPVKKTKSKKKPKKK